MQAPRPARLPSLIPILLAASLLAGCSQAPLAANAEPDRPSVPGVLRVESAEAVATLSVTAAPVAGLDRVCVFIGRDADSVDQVAAGTIVLVWESEAAPPDLAVDAIGANTATAKGGSPLSLEWTAENGPAALPFRVEVGLSGTTPAVQQEVQMLVLLESTAPDVEIMQGPCT